jgi:hypothetical protein
MTARRRNRLDGKIVEEDMRQFTIGTRVHLRSDKTRAVHVITHIIVSLDMFDQVSALFFLDDGAIRACPFEVIQAIADDEKREND